MSLMGFEPLTSDVGSCYQLSNHHWPTQATLLLENHSTIQKSVATPIQNQPISWPKIDLLLFKLILSVNFRLDLPIDWLHRYLKSTPCTFCPHIKRYRVLENPLSVKRPRTGISYIFPPSANLFRGSEWKKISGAAEKLFSSDWKVKRIFGEKNWMEKIIRQWQQ